MPKMRKTFRLCNRLCKGPNLISAYSERENSRYLYGMLSEREIARAFWKEKEEKLLAFPEELEPVHFGGVFKAFFD